MINGAKGPSSRILSFLMAFFFFMGLGVGYFVCYMQHQPH
jgi:hypothetical protein